MEYNLYVTIVITVALLNELLLHSITLGWEVTNTWIKYGVSICSVRMTQDKTLHGVTPQNAYYSSWLSVRC